MKIAVCIKQVPDTASKIRVQDDGSGIISDGLKYVVNPYDEYAIEEALKIKEKNGAGEVILLCIGPKRSEEAIRYALAMGADRAVHFMDPTFDKLDSLATARLLAKFIQEEEAELVFCGKQAVDGDNTQVPQMLGELLGWPCITVVEGLSLDGTEAEVTRRISGGARELWRVSLPAVFSAEKGLNSPRYASLPGIMKAKSKPLKVVDKAACGLSEEDLEPLVAISAFAYPAERKTGQIIEGEPREAAQKLVRLLREEAKVI